MGMLDDDDKTITGTTLFGEGHKSTDKGDQVDQDDQDNHY